MKYSFVVKSLLVVLFSLTLTACDDDDKSVVIPRSEDPSDKDASNSNSSASADDTLKRQKDNSSSIYNLSDNDDYTNEYKTPKVDPITKAVGTYVLGCRYVDTIGLFRALFFIDELVITDEQIVSNQIYYSDNQCSEELFKVEKISKIDEAEFQSDDRFILYGQLISMIVTPLTDDGTHILNNHFMRPHGYGMRKWTILQKQDVKSSVSNKETLRFTLNSDNTFSVRQSQIADNSGEFNYTKKDLDD